MTQREWDEKWLAAYDQAWMKTRDHQKSFDYAHKHMLAQFGPRPEGEPGPPWWMKMGALAIGVNMQKIWDFMNGKKLIFGAILTALASIAGILPVILAAVGVEAILVAKVVGIATMIVGAAHKIYKFIYKEDHA